MNFKAFIDFFTMRDSETYSLAKDKLCNIKNKISNVMVVIPDVTIAEMVFVQNKWQEIPDSMGKNVNMLGLKIGNNVKTILTIFDEGSVIYEHEHLRNYEFMYVCEGTLKVSLNGNINILNKGEGFLVRVGEKHSISSPDGASVLTRYSNDINEVLINNTEINQLY